MALTLEAVLQAYPEIQSRVFPTYPQVAPSQMFCVIEHGDAFENLPLYENAALESKLIDFAIYLPWLKTSSEAQDPTPLWNFCAKILELPKLVKADRSGQVLTDCVFEIRGQPREDKATNSFVSSNRVRVFLERP